MAQIFVAARGQEAMEEEGLGEATKQLSLSFKL